MLTTYLLDLVKLVLLAILYLFLARVLWTVWVSVRSPARNPTPQLVAAPTRLVDIVTGADWPLPAEGTSIVLGRDPACDIHLDDPSVSSRHCRITMRDGQPLVDDLSSTNGTIINTARITGTHLLAAGDLITLGTISVEARP